ncbi:MAG: ribosomal RNA small subunit methyltransferase A, partial [Chlamydiia bacterium]
RLLEHPNHLLLVEKDPLLLPKIEKRLKSHPHARLINNDILDFDFQEAIFFLEAPFALISNLPYHISTPFLERIVDNHPLFTKIQLLLQKEVVDKVLTRSGPDVAKISILIDLFYNKGEGIPIPPKAFTPPPRVDSKFLTLTPKMPLLDPAELPGFKNFIHTAFNHRKHTLHWLFKKLHLPVPTDSDRKIEDLSTPEWVNTYHFSLQNR